VILEFYIPNQIPLFEIHAIPILGQLTLHKLRLKKGALDKFRLPVDVIEGIGPPSAVHSSNLYIHSIPTIGHLGKFTLSLHWMNLGNQPVEILIEDVYLLVTPSPQGEEDPEDEANRAHAAKMERLENAELLHMRSQSEVVTGLQRLFPSFPIMRSFCC
jgi:vacuolar protein sorting-associated protein 13A/C